MLSHLTLRDFVIVDRLELDFAKGFGTMTGETGAGKSILIDALSLLLGERADAGVIRAGCERAEVAANFAAEGLPEVQAWLQANDLAADDDLLLRRVIDAGGRSRAYINGSPATVQQLRELGEFLVDIHGQHAHQSLLRAEAQRQLLDSHAGQGEQVRQVAALYKAWQAAEAALAQAAAGGEAAACEREQLSWQVQELSGLAFSAEEWGELEQEHKRLSHAASLIEGAQFALAQLAEGDGACGSQLDGVEGRLAEMADFDPELAPVLGLVQSAQAEVSEAVSALRRYADRVDLDPARLGEVERRLEAILGSARKFRVRPEELPALLAGWQQRLATLEQSTDLGLLQQRAVAARAAYQGAAEALSVARRQTAAELGAAVTQIMRQLALASGVFEIALLPLEQGAAYGLEQVEFRISGLAGSAPKSLAKVASGGELSRISLAIQVVTSRSARVPTLIFDEVDVGIGGGVAEIVGRLLSELGGERQVLCVTHLPQVAACAHWQWRVSKSASEAGVLSRIEVLDEAGRIGEIARMLGGLEITDITRQHARQLLGLT